jgi:hypothetical protein
MRQEIQEDIHKTKEANVAFALGAAAGGVSLTLIGFAAVYVLAAISALPLWSSFAIVTTVLMIVAAVRSFMGKQNVASLRPQHEPASASSTRTQLRP